MVVAQLQQKEYFDQHGKTRFETTLRRGSVVVAIQYQNYNTIEERGLEEKRTIQNLAKSSKERISAGLTSLNGHTQHIPHLPPRTLPRQLITFSD